jgi:ATP-dependent Lhr-like helicase
VERLALGRSLDGGLVVIDVTKPAWRDEYVATIENDGRAALEAPYRERDAISAAIRESVVTPVERSGLRVYGRVTAVHQRRGFVRAELSLAEELQ